jgi:hypothetical protein
MRRAERSRDSYSTLALISPARAVLCENWRRKWAKVNLFGHVVARCTRRSPLHQQHTLMYNKKARSLCGSTPSNTYKNCLHVIFNCGQLASFAPWLPILRKHLCVAVSLSFSQAGQACLEICYQKEIKILQWVHFNLNFVLLQYFQYLNIGRNFKVNHY